MIATLITITTLFTGLMAGLFYSWTISVTPGLSKIEDKSFLQAFQSMNRAIINPIFLICFMSLTVLLPLSSYLLVETEKFHFVLAATALYLFGVMLVTFIGNIPLNNKLEKLKIESMTSEQMLVFRQRFENRWNKLNLIRTISSTVSFILMIIAASL